MSLLSEVGNNVSYAWIPTYCSTKTKTNQQTKKKPVMRKTVE